MKMDDAAREVIVKRKQFALYVFTNLIEYHLSQDLLTGNLTQFVETFTSTLKENNPKVKVSSLKAKPELCKADATEICKLLIDCFVKGNL